MHRKFVMTVATLALAAISPSAQQLKEIPADALKVGAQAPPLAFDAVIGGPKPAEITWDALKGKVVVLDFWGTWCGPCVDNLPHLNSLVRRYKGKPVQFISVGHENTRKVDWFLRKYPIEAWVGLDIQLAMYKSYTAWGIPHAVVVDAQGKVAAILHPKHLSEAIIDAVLEGKSPEYPKLTAASYWNPVTAAEHFRKVGEEGPPTH